jgi:hypothetical protein
MIKYFTILGERTSGTTFLEEAITNNFNIQITWKYGRKHEFGFNEYKNSDDTLFIGIVRNPFDWINSLYISPWHLQYNLITSITNFLNEEFYSNVDDYNNTELTNKEVMTHRHIYTKERYKNIFEARKIKVEYLFYEMKNKVKNYFFLRYEDLVDNYEYILNQIGQKYNLKIKHPIIRINYYKSNKGQSYIKNNIFINKTLIYNHKDFDKSIEKSLKYI